MNYTVAETYSGWEWLGEPFEVNKKMYVNIRHKCPKCGGNGLIWIYGHIDGGLCWECMGAGFEDKTVRAYTESEAAANARAKERRAEKALNEKLTNAEKTLYKWLESNGFNNDKNTYIYFGNTYAIKDVLKAGGAKYNPTLGWHSPDPIQVPAENPVELVSFDMLYTSNDYGYCNEKPNIKEVMASLSKKYVAEEPEEESGEYVGEIGQRLRNIPAKITTIREFESAYGYSQAITFVDTDNHTFVWITSSLQDVEEGTNVTLSGTVKEFKVFRNIKETVLTRCKIG